MKTIYFTLIITILAFSSNAQQNLSLQDAIEKALANNYDLILIKGDQQIAEINNSWGNAGRYPYISFSLGDNNSATFKPGDNTIANSFSTGLGLNWTIFEGFAVRISKQRYEELENLSKQNTAIMVENTIQAVILAYFDVLLQKEKLEVYREVMALSEDRYLHEQAKKDFGASVTYDVLQAQNSYLSDRSDFLRQEVAWKNSLRNLNYLMTEAGQATYNLTEKFEALPVDYSLSELEARLLENNKTLLNQYINQQLLKNALASAKSSYMPSVSLSSGLSANSTRSRVGDADASWGETASLYGNITLSLNLFSGGSRKRAVQIAKIDEELGLVETSQVKHELTNSLSNLFEYYLVRKELLEVARENLEAASLNLQISGEKFETGAINSFNFRDVQNIYLNAAVQNLEAIYNFIDTHTSLLRMTGTIIQEYE